MMELPKRFSGSKNFRGSHRGSSRPPRGGFSSRKFLSQSMGSLPLSNRKQDESTEGRFSPQPNETDVSTKTSRNQSSLLRGKSRTQSRENLTQSKATTTFKTTTKGPWRKLNHPARPHEGRPSAEFKTFESLRNFMNPDWSSSLLHVFYL